MRCFRRMLPLLLLLFLPLRAWADTTITLTFTGDVTLGGEDWNRAEPESFDSVYDRYGPEYFLGNFADYFAEDDLTVINLEGVLSDDPALLPAEKRSVYYFRGRTEFTNILTAASVEAASLANNHSQDYGLAGLRDTINALEGAGVGWFGTHSRNTTDTEKFLFYEKDGVTICLMSLAWEDYRQGDENGNGAYLRQQIQRLKSTGQADAVIAVFHGGQEYGEHRTNPQTVFTDMAMKAGADLVICHHAHVVMGMDVIGNRTALYSLGNFCFGGNRETYMWRADGYRDAAPALIVRAELTFADDGTYKGQQLTLLPVQTTSVDRAMGEQANDYRPKFVTGPLAARALRLLRNDMCYDLRNQQNKTLKEFVDTKVNELAAMESSEGLYALTLPYLPAQ